MGRQRIGWAGVLFCVGVGCAAEGAKPEKDSGSLYPEDAHISENDPIQSPDDADPGAAADGAVGDAGNSGDPRTDSGVDGPDGGSRSDAGLLPVDPGLDAQVGQDPQDGAVVADGSTPPVDGPHDAFCSGKGPVIQVPVSSGSSSSGDVCTGTIARRVFKNAICTCDDVWFAGYLDTGSFSSSDDGEDVVRKQGGAVGINGSLSAGSYIDVGGSFRIQGNTNVEDTFKLSDPTLAGGWVNVAGDLESANPMALAGLLTVARDARFASSALFLGVAAIGGTLTLPPGSWLPAVASAYKAEQLKLEPPCPCEPEEIIDVGAIVAQGKLKNDNHNPAVKLDPGALSNLGFAQRITLPCGRFYLDSIGGIGAVTVRVTGRTALFVGGNVSTVGAFNIELGPDAELDLFIAGNLTQVGFSPLGDRRRPANVRIFVGGEGDITLVGYEPINANIYAPRSRLYSPGHIAARGSLFVRSLHAQGYVKVAYDTDILTRGDDEACLPPASEPDAGTPEEPECKSVCDEACGSVATCVDGSCQRCETDADCCAPLVCYENGRCGALVL